MVFAKTVILITASRERGIEDWNTDIEVDWSNND